MLKSLSLTILGFVLFLSAACRASEIRVQVFRGAEMIQAVTLPEGKLKVAAKKFDFDSEANAWNLTGGCAITVAQDEKHSIRFEGETAKIVAANEDIEWQILSSDAVDISNIPMSDLSKALKKSPKVKLVRLMWFYSMGGYWRENTGIYNREDYTIKEYALEGDSSAGTGGVYKYSYTGVTDEMIYKAAQEENSPSGPFSFGSLIDQGAVRNKIR